VVRWQFRIERISTLEPLWCNAIYAWTRFKFRFDSGLKLNDVGATRHKCYKLLVVEFRHNPVQLGSERLRMHVGPGPNRCVVDRNKNKWHTERKRTRTRLRLQYTYYTLGVERWHGLFHSYSAQLARTRDRTDRLATSQPASCVLRYWNACRDIALGLLLGPTSRRNGADAWHFN